jgi:Protein of unknown function (DUF4239)
MDPITISVISFAFILAGALLGYFLGGILPENHLTQESKEAVKMGWGIIATMSALVLSLLVASAKNTFDSVGVEYTDTAVKYIVLNHILAGYGAEADGVRSHMFAAVAAGIKRDFPEEKINSSVPAASEHSNLMEAIHDEISKLAAGTDEQRKLKAQAEQVSSDLSTSRWRVIEQSRTYLPNALFVALVFWLAILFVGLGLFSPRNQTVLWMLVLCSLSVSIAIYLITDLSHPLRGIVQVSSAPVLDAFKQLAR